VVAVTVVSAVGACTPVGLHAEATCAALRVGIANMTEIYTHAVRGELMDREPMVGGRVPTEWLLGEPVAEAWPGHERFGLRPPAPATGLVEPGIERVLELCRVALEEVRASAALGEVAPDRYRVYLALGEDEPAGTVLEELRGVLGGRAERFVIDCGGRAAGLALLMRALGDLEAHRCEGVLLGGVDSLIRQPVARRLDQARRLKSFTEPQGLIPGVAAAFVYLESAAQARRRGRTCHARVSACAVAEEPTVAVDAPNLAVGLTRALRAARQRVGLDAMPFVVCDLNGERPRALEWTLAATRVLGDLAGDLDVWHPADCIGDAGAAAAVLDLLWAAVAFARGYAPRERALVWGASDGSLRAAAILEAQP
jgi:3-oxoacyl-[acyl-carrier-protein] synthase-1